jgi:hypothetical protein
MAGYITYIWIKFSLMKITCTFRTLFSVILKDNLASYPDFVFVC